jgi:excisionase family DNA binding protein
MEQNLNISIPSEITIREIVKEELMTFFGHLTNHLKSKDQPIYLTSIETAELLHISMPTLRRWTKDGILPKYKFGGSRKVLYKYEEVKQILEKKNLMKWRLAS